MDSGWDMVRDMDGIGLEIMSIVFLFFLRGRFIDINKLLYRIVEKKRQKKMQ